MFSFRKGESNNRNYTSEQFDHIKLKIFLKQLPTPVMLTKSGISLLDTLYDLELKYRDTDSNKFKQLIVAIKVDLMNLLRENSKVNKRWFDGKLKVKDIKERCKWKAYKVLYSGYNQGVDKGDQFLNMKKMYVLERNGLEGAWIIHGRHRVRRNGLSIITTNDLMDELMAKDILKTPPSVEEVMETVNKFRMGTLNEDNCSIISQSIKKYT
ncbi:hypothetical protein GLOIN_2v1771457 [Rhizophagus irregularis DAOM 181602=DAOM 197198]|nr:hypothetical protein GLOIN_2v1771457 [Rhizophagus irregularis DAOM 181602=DAOM 197198]